MESLDVRLRTYMPLWGQWMLGNRIYHSGRCSVYLLHCNRLKEERTCVVKAVTLLDSGDALQEKLGMALEEICAMERLQDCENIVAIQDDLEIPLRDSHGELLGYDVLIRGDIAFGFCDGGFGGSALLVEVFDIAVNGLRAQTLAMIDDFSSTLVDGCCVVTVQICLMQHF